MKKMMMVMMIMVGVVMANSMNEYIRLSKELKAIEYYFELRPTYDSIQKEMDIVQEESTVPLFKYEMFKMNNVITDENYKELDSLYQEYIVFREKSNILFGKLTIIEADMISYKNKHNIHYIESNISYRFTDSDYQSAQRRYNRLNKRKAILERQLNL